MEDVCNSTIQAILKVSPTTRCFGLKCVCTHIKWNLCPMTFMLLTCRQMGAGYNNKTSSMTQQSPFNVLQGFSLLRFEWTSLTILGGGPAYRSVET